MNTLDAIFTRRSIRAFQIEPLGDNELRTLIEAGAAAPRAGNIQSLIFLSIRNPKRIMAVQAFSPGIISRPAGIIVLCADYRETGAPNEQMAEMIAYNLGAALQNILLAATELGLGGSPVASFHPQALAHLLNLPAEVHPKLLVTIGRPRFIPPQPPKKSLHKIFFEETFRGEP